GGRSTPCRSRISVVLPAPLPPMMAWMVPGATARSIRSLATRSPKRRVTPRAPRRTAGRAGVSGAGATRAASGKSGSLLEKVGIAAVDDVPDLELARQDLGLELSDLLQVRRRDDVLGVLHLRQANAVFP